MTRARWCQSIGTFLALAVIVGTQVGCSRESAAGKAGEDSQGSGNKADLFTVPQDQLQHLQLVTLQRTNWPRVLHLTGTVAFNGFETTPVISQVGGPVSRILVSPGELVHKRQPLLYISSPDYSQLRASYLKARDAHALAHKNYARAQDL